jgi:transposase
MPRILPALPCTPEQREILLALSRGQKVEARLKERARVVLRGVDGVGIKDTAKEMGLNKDTVSLWRDRFLTDGVPGLQDRPRSGAPRKYGPELRERLLTQLELAPPVGFGHWDGPLLASALGIPAWCVWDILRTEGICLARRRSWCVSRDPDFAAKAAEVVALYLAPPENAIVFSVDEKPSIQAITRPTGFAPAGKKVVHGDKSTYKRNGTTTLFAALEVATGQVIGKTHKTKTRKDFLGLHG